MQKSADQLTSVGITHACPNNYYRSLAKKGPVSNICPPPTIALISCNGLKFTPKSAHPIHRVWKVLS